MKKLLLFMLVVFFSITGLETYAQEPGDVGSLQCRFRQTYVQYEMFQNGYPSQNHGRLVGAVAMVISEFEESGDITEECASCIISQFALRIPVPDQEPCGPLPASPEACCFSDRSCVDFTPDDCTNQGGTPQGLGTSCIQPTCEATCLSNDECNADEFCLLDGCSSTVGECYLRPIECSTIFDAVCGCDGQTYGNACEAASAGVNVDYLGECGI